MKKIFSFLCAALMVMSASAQDLSKFKKLSAENCKFEPIERPTTSPIRKATAAWENVKAPFAEKYNATGKIFVKDSQWDDVTPWEMWAESYDYQGKTYYGLVNVIPNEDMWVEDPVVDYYYDAEKGQVLIPSTALAYYDQEHTQAVFILDLWDFLNGSKTGDIYFTLDKNGNFARPDDIKGHAIVWGLASIDNSTYKPITYYGTFMSYADLEYTKAAPTALSNTAAAVKATKIIENGQVVILRDGKKFSALGAEL